MRSPPRSTRQHGACHLLVCNAGIGGGRLRGREDLDDALEVIDVNLAGTLRCCAAFADLLTRSAPSQVVNVASVAGKLGLGPAAYVASKFGMVGLSEALGVAWRERGITVTQLNPGFVQTEGFPQSWADGTPIARLVVGPEVTADALMRAVRRRREEVTSPRWYRAFVVLRHVATPVWRGVGRLAEGPRQRNQALRARTPATRRMSGIGMQGTVPTEPHAQDPNVVLRDVFGFPEFRPSQREVIAHVVAGGDAMVVMPTGSGKSLCYQVPAIAREGTGIIISPLIALMRDQVEDLRERGVRAAYLNSTLSFGGCTGGRGAVRRW
jgi:NAD(P)-dependent dehydrogenase (short-subunit alcohol dehydrogenase family)